MGFTVPQIHEMSLWQFMAQVDGYVAANSPEGEKGGTLSDAEINDLAKFMDET